jgi:hypothetical protein
VAADLVSGDPQGCPWGSRRREPAQAFGWGRSEHGALSAGHLLTARLPFDGSG